MQIDLLTNRPPTDFFYYLPNSSLLPSVLCCSITSVYKEIFDLDFYDINRCYSTFIGLNPIVCHPPCRSWSRFLKHQAKPLEGERQIAIDCVNTLISNGGVLEHPAHSELFDYMSLPKPDDFSHPDFFTVKVNQSWFGYPTLKPTWLLISKDIEEFFFTPLFFIPFRDIPILSKTSSREFRSLTTRPFAEFLIKIASFSTRSNS